MVNPSFENAATISIYRDLKRRITMEVLLLYYRYQKIFTLCSILRLSCVYRV